MRRHRLRRRKNPPGETKTPDKPSGLPGASLIIDAVLKCAVLHPTGPKRAQEEPSKLRNSFQARSAGCFATPRRCTSELGPTRPDLGASRSGSIEAGSEPRLTAKIVWLAPPVRPFAQKLTKNPVAQVTTAGAASGTIRPRFWVKSSASKGRRPRRPAQLTGDKRLRWLRSAVRSNPTCERESNPTCERDWLCAPRRGTIKKPRRPSGPAWLFCSSLPRFSPAA
ncbi:hypothetical protein Pla108_09750 [Botrimarina colliarenosi]|uniref:Uncharacterized protein n=1 Tax=Botrimarina colliarenosi TaxID=2528001 RepID=A0A5C6AM04_9BACT|nr:hypothetical protein Pla108_09750 [Botrimarina colliarenosi]